MCTIWIATVRITEWWHRNEEDAQESLNESYALIPHLLEHVPHFIGTFG